MYQDISNKMSSKLNLVKVSNNTIINPTYIRWIGKQDQCFRICNKLDGCLKESTHLLCKTDNPQFYKEIEQLFNNPTHF